MNDREITPEAHPSEREPADGAAAPKSGGDDAHASLLGCPFCGRPPRGATRPSTGDQPWVSFIYCHCGGYSARAHQFGEGETPDLSVAAVVEKWNRRAAVAGPLRGWGARTTIEGARLQQFWNGGAVAGWVEQFAENAPAAYATVHLRRLGAFSSWDAARAAVEKHVPFVDEGDPTPAG